MRAMVFSAPGDLQLGDWPLAEPEDDEVMVQLDYCGICPWDVRGYRGLARGIQYPRLLGHEASGRVSQVGSAVRGVAAGQTVVVDFIVKCGTCAACRRGMGNLCQRPTYGRGGFAAAVVVPESNVYPLNPATPMQAAAFTEPLACVLRGERMLRIQPGETVLVIGTGPIGLLHIQVARLFGGRVIAADLRPERLEVARQMGAAAVINTSEVALKDGVLAATDGWGADAAAITVGSARLVEETLDVLARGGRMNIFAGIYPKEPVSLDPHLIHYRELQVLASSDSAPADFRQALSLIEGGQVEVLPLISHLLPLEQLTEGMEIVKAAQGLKVMIDTHA